MNKDEIKKALECCCGYEASCDNCPNAKNKEYGCKDKLLANVHNLITEQEKEIDLLKMQLQDAVDHGNTFLEEANKFEAENKRLKAENKQRAVDYDILYTRCTKRLKQAKIDVLNELKEKKLMNEHYANIEALKASLSQSGPTYSPERLQADIHSLSSTMTLWDIDEMIEELKE